VGVLGGAFNPPHLGHLVLAQEAIVRLGLAEVALVPTGTAPHKTIEDDPGAEVRLEMTMLAAERHERIRVLDVETERDEPSYTYRTLELLTDQWPQVSLHFVMGSDVAAGLETWHTPERILELAELGVAERPGSERSEVNGVLERLGALDRTTFFDMPAIEVSSSMVRRRVAGGEPIRYLVPDPVAELIAERGLYTR
jgi:nicotinate-nucleotide adenylyltransferase